MKKLFTTIALVHFSYLSFSQNVDTIQLKAFVGKAVTILQQSANYESREPILPKTPINYRNSEFIELWQKLKVETHGFKNIVVNKEYTTNHTEEIDFEIPVWTLIFLSKTSVSLKYYSQMGRVNSTSYTIKYDLLNSYYNTSYENSYCGIGDEGHGHKCETFVVVIKNDLVVKKEHKF